MVCRGKHNFTWKGKIMISKSCALFSIVIVISNGICVFGQNRDVTDSTEILLRYKESLSWIQSVSMKIDIIKTGPKGFSDKPPYQKRSLTFCQDGNRIEWIAQITPFNNRGNPDLANSYITKDIFTGRRYLNVTSNIDKPPMHAIISDNYEEDIKKQNHPNFGGVFQGRIFGNDYKSIPVFLSSAPNVFVRDSIETIDGTLCHVLEATTKYGKVTMWVAPEKGYNALKWIIHKSRDDFFDETPISNIKLDSWTAVFDSVELQKVDDVFVPKGAVFTLTIKNTDGNTRVTRYEYKISNIQLNPDFDALGTFKIDLPDGTPVLHREFPSIKYVWQNGRLVTKIDEKFIADLDSEIEKLGNEAKAESTATDKKTEISREESAVISDTQTDTEEAEREVPEVLSESGSSPVLVLALIGLLIIGVIGWVAFRRLKA